MRNRKTKISKQNYKKGFESEDRDIQKNSRSKGKTNSERSDRDWISSTGKPTNDPAWYVNNPVLSRDVGTLYFSRPTGTPYPDTTLGTYTTRTYEHADPGILSLPTVASWGSWKDAPLGSASINLTAQKLYQYVVHANSRNVSYDKKDLMLSMMAIDAIYMTITEAIRAYRLIANYDPQNRYVDHLLTAMNWDSANLRQNVAEFRYTINWAITRVNKFFMPSLFDMTKAHMSLYDNIYLDRPSLKGQMIVKYSPGLWIYYDDTGSLEYVERGKSYDGSMTVNWHNAHTVNAFKDAMNVMLGNIENSQYMGIMQGDLLKAFGMENMSQYAYIGIDMPIAPVYDEEMLYKLHNGTICTTSAANFFTHDTHGVTAAGAMIYRDTDAVDGNIVEYHNTPMTDTARTLLYTVHIESAGMLIDLPAGINPTSDNVILMNVARLGEQIAVSAKWHLDDASAVELYHGVVPPEMYLASSMWFFDDDGSFSSVTFHSFGITDLGSTRIGLLTRFHGMPLISSIGTSSSTVAPAFIWETDNVTVLKADLLRRINDVIYWSLWSNATIANVDTNTRDTRV